MGHLEHVVHVCQATRHPARDAVLRGIVDRMHPGFWFVQILMEGAHHKLHHDGRPPACHEHLAKGLDQVGMIEPFRQLDFRGQQLHC